MLDRNLAREYLKESLQNQNADFRKDQFEAIDAVINKKQKVLVVQKTGWGKSSVYFISAKFLRDKGCGITIIISPLLALMRNQIQSAKKLGLKTVTINSSNGSEWENIKNEILSNKIDALLISPERLANEDFMKNILSTIASNIALFVIDEAHCISDWGHDFRPDYKRIMQILKLIPDNTPILATTATANDRVINDISAQIKNLVVIRGDLKRESLYLYTIKLPHAAHRLAWLAQHIPNFPGSGIVYVLRQRDARIVSDWLNKNSISAKAYYSDIKLDENDSNGEYREYLEDQLINNKIKVLVATSALGMGFDKSDLSFVIHYQAPGSIINYYQQVGRAGRGIDMAYGILLSGHEDDDINEYFRSSSFPSQQNIEDILQCLNNNDGLSIYQIQRHLNLKQSEIEKTLKYLGVEINSPVKKINSKWYRTANNYENDRTKVDSILKIRKAEWNDMQEYLETSECLMAFLQKKLNDNNPTPCGKCKNCKPFLDESFSQDLSIKAQEFLYKTYINFTPKKQIKNQALMNYGFNANFPQELLPQDGKILSRWNDGGWGKMVADCKHNGNFNDQLVDAFVKMIRECDIDGVIGWVTCIPSLNHKDLVPNFAKKVAQKLNLPFIEAISKVKQNEQQKMMQNSYHQAKNLDGVFKIIQINPKPVLLIDDIIDSGWTISVVSALLRQKGSGEVYPAALATTGKM